MSKRLKDSIVMGFALFAIFFGSGNLIFPPKLGLMAGTSYLPAMLGYFTTAVGLPLLGLIAVAKAGGTIDCLVDRVGHSFSNFMGTAIFLAIGPFFAIPRTVATTYEVLILPNFPNVADSLLCRSAFTLVYLLLAAYFILHASKVVDSIGKILTPILLVALVIIIARGLFAPLGAPVDTGMATPYTRGFLEGYQTMDALGSILSGGLMLAFLKERGYTEEKDKRKALITASVIAVVMLAFVYGGLLSIGKDFSATVPADIEKTVFLTQMTRALLGNVGTVLFALCVAMACFTTTIGLTTSSCIHFNGICKDKISYNYFCVIVLVISGVIATVGVEKITIYAVPVLLLMYPVTIVIVLTSYIDRFVNRGTYIGVVAGALSVSVFDAMGALGINTAFIQPLFSRIPLYSYGLGWVFPAIVLGLLGSLLYRFLRKKPAVPQV